MRHFAIVAVAVASMAIMATAFLGTGSGAQGDGSVTVDDVRYELNSPGMGQAVAVGVAPDAKDVVVMRTLEVEGSVYLVQGVERQAFKNSKLKSVVLEDGLRYVRESGFEGCTDLRSVSMGNSVESLGIKSFFGFTSLNSVELSAGLEKIPASCFQNCSKLPRVSIPDGVTVIDEMAFYGCYMLEKAEFTSGSALVRIGKGAFRYCRVMVTFECPDGVKNIDQYAFSGCKCLKTIDLGKSLETLGTPWASSQRSGNVFDGTGIRTLSFPATYKDWPWVSEVTFGTLVGMPLESIEVDADNPHFYSSEGVLYKKDSSNELILYPKCKSGDFKVPSNVFSVVQRAFAYCTELGRVEFQNAHATLPEGAFRYSSVKEVVLPTYLETIPRWAFNGCASLERVTMPANVKHIEASAFANCSKLSGLAFPDTVLGIGDAAFNGCESLALDLEISADIGNRAFQRSGVKSLKIGYFGDELSIGTEAFAGCPDLVSASFGEKVRSIGVGSFHGCPKLSAVSVAEGNATYSSDGTILYRSGGTEVVFCAPTKSGEVVLPEAVERLNAYSFESCKLITGITIGNGVRAIPDYCFRGCESLASAILPAGIQAIGLGAFQHSGLTSIDVHSAAIGESAFMGCPNLAEVDGTPSQVGGKAFGGSPVSKADFVTGMATIPNGAFEGAAFTHLDLSHASSIGLNAFRDCKALETVTFREAGVDIGTDAFSGCVSLGTLELVKGSVGMFAFSGCKSMTSVSLGDGVASIDGWAFDGCSSLMTVGLPTALSTIPNYAFRNCHSLENVNLDGVTMVNWGAFEGCTSLGSVDFPQESVFVSLHAFDGCVSLAEVKMRRGTLSNSAFADCVSLKTFRAESVFSVATDSCIVNSGIENVYLGKDAYGIALDVFSSCMKVKGVHVTEGNPNIMSHGGAVYEVRGGSPHSLLYCPPAAEGITILEGVTHIKKGAFDNCAFLRSVEIPSSVISIDGMAFGDSALEEIVLGGTGSGILIEDGIVYSDQGRTLAFCTKGKIGYVSIPDNVTTVSDMAFSGCAGITGVDIGGGVSHIGDGSFSGCTGIEGISIPDNVKSMGSGAFSGCVSASSLSIGAGLEYIGRESFSGCASLVSVTVPGNVYAIGDLAFSECVGMKSFTMLEGVTSLGVDIVRGCSGLTTLSIPSTLVEMGLQSDGHYNYEQIGEGCVNLVTIEVAPGNKVYSFADGFLLQYGNIPVAKTRDFEIANLQSFAYQILVGDNGLKGMYCDLTSSVGNKMFDRDGVLYEGSVFYKTAYLRAYPSAKVGPFHVWDGVTSIDDGVFEGCVGITSVTADPANRNFAVRDGVLYSGDFKTLVLCPSGFRGVLTVPAETETVRPDAFPASSGITSVAVEQGNRSFRSHGGALYTSDMSTLVFCPAGIGPVLDVFPSVVRIRDGSLNGCDFETLNVPAAATVGRQDCRVGTLAVSGPVSSDNVTVGGYPHSNTLSLDISEPVYVGGVSGRTAKNLSLTPDTKKAFGGFFVDEHSNVVADPASKAGRDYSWMGGWIQSGASEFATVVAECERGVVVDAEGNPFYESALTEPVTLRYVPVPGFEIVGWDVSGVNCRYDVNPDMSVTVSSAVGTVTVTPETRNYSTSSNLIEVIDAETPVQGDELTLKWSFGSANVRMQGSSWVGMPSVPLVVGDRVYVRAGGVLYSLDVSNGRVLNSVDSPGNVGFYHNLSYGSGVILDCVAHKAYDLDLNLLYGLPADLAFARIHDDGFFYGFSDKGDRAYKISPAPGKDLMHGSKVNLFTKDLPVKAFGQFGNNSSLVFLGDYMYFIEADDRDGNRAIAAFNLAAEEVTRCDIPGLHGMLLDDGWLTHYGGYLYLTGYSVGLFGEEFSGNNSRIAYVPVDGGVFGTPSHVDVVGLDGAPYRTIVSAFLVHDGRGYLNANAHGGAPASFLCYDVGPDGKPVLSAQRPSANSHGSLVLTTAYLGEGDMYVYLLPYASNAQALYVFKDSRGDGSWTLSETVSKLPTRKDWGSQAIRAGPNGEIIYYVDSGKIDCYVAVGKTPTCVIVQDGGDAVALPAAGKDLFESLRDPFPTLVQDGEFIIVNGTRHRLYGFNDSYGVWTPVRDARNGNYVTEASEGITTCMFGHVMLVAEGSDMLFSAAPPKGLYRGGPGGPTLVDIYDAGSMSSALGMDLVVLDGIPAVTTVPGKKTLRVGDVAVVVPVYADGPVSWSTSDVGVAALESLPDGSVRVTAKRPGAAILRAESGGIAAECAMAVLPATVVNPDGSTSVTDVQTVQVAGGTVETETTVTVYASGNVETVALSTHKDTGGNTVRTVRVTVTVENGVNSWGVPYESMERTEETKDADGSVASLRSEAAYTTRTVNPDGTTTTITDRAVREGNTLMKERETVTETASRVSSDAEGSVKDDDGKIVSTHARVSETDKGTDTTVSYSIATSGPSSTMEAGSDISANGNADAALSIWAEIAPEGFLGVPFRITVGQGADHATLRSISRGGAWAVFTSDGCEIALSPKSSGNVSSMGNAAFSATPVPLGDLTPAQRESAAGAKVYDVALKVGEDEVHVFGDATITLGFRLGEGEDPDSLRIFKIGEDGTVTPVEGAGYNPEKGAVEFTVGRLSLYAITFEPAAEEIPTEENGVDGGRFPMAIIVTTVAIASAVAAIILLRSRRRR